MLPKEQVADEVLLQLRRLFGSEETASTFYNAIAALNNIEQREGAAAVLGAGVFYFSRLIKAKQGGQMERALEIDREALRLAQLITGDRVVL